MMLFWFLLSIQFVFGAERSILVTLDTLYAGTVGDGQYFHFVNPDKSSFLYIIHLATVKGTPITLFRCLIYFVFFIIFFL